MTLLPITPCNYGGFRYWFLCPLAINGEPCHRRVAKLYLPPGERYLGYRHCYNLTYRSQREHDRRLDDLVRDPQKLIEALNSDKVRRRMLGARAYLKMIEQAGRSSG